jgi:hypothetical protein
MKDKTKAKTTNPLSVSQIIMMFFLLYRSANIPDKGKLSSDAKPDKKAEIPTKVAELVA